MAIWDTPKDWNSTTQTGSSIGTVHAGPEAWMKNEGQAAYTRAKKSLPTKFTPYKWNRVADYGWGYDHGKSLLAQMGVDSNSTYGQTRGKLDELWGANAGALKKTASDYMSPYTDAVLQPQLRQIDESRRVAGREDDRAATMAGAFGDPQAGLRKASTNAKFHTMQSDATGKAYADAWDKGQTQHNTEMSRLMALPGMYQSVDGQKFDQDSAITKAWTNFGVADQALKQKQLDVKYDNWLKKKGWGVNRAETLMKLLGMVPHDKSQLSQNHQTGYGMNIKPGENDWMQLLGKVGGSALGGGFGEKLGDWLFG